LHAGGKWLRGRERCDEGRKRERKERGRKRVEPSAVLSVLPLSVISRVFFFYYRADAFDTSVILKYIMCRSLCVG